MLLQFRKEHLSIKRFRDVNVPEFVVLTGENGSGKSHLLQALEQGHVQLQGLETRRIVHFNNETFRLENEASFSAQQIANEQAQAWNFFQQNVRAVAQSWRNQLGADYETARPVQTDERHSFWASLTSKFQGYRTQFVQFFEQPKLKGNAHAQYIAALAKNLPYGLDEVTERDFAQFYKPLPLKNNFLPNQLGRAFWDYYVKENKNEFNIFQNERNGTNHPVLGEKEFVQIHGPKPWDLGQWYSDKESLLEYETTSSRF